MSAACSIGHSCGLDMALLWLWLWHRPAAAAPIQSLAWEIPYATGAALKEKKKKKPKIKAMLVKTTYNSDLNKHPLNTEQ